MATTLERYEEHQFKRTIPGNIETVRKRICDVLEDLEYAVLGDNPIQGKRRRRRNLWIATVLEYQTQLTIALKPISDASTLATFDYEVEYLFSKGDRRTLEREADAIIALATQPPGSSICKACGIENDTGVRFCRACGTPVGQQPALAEFELMRMSADVSAAHIEATVALWTQILVLAMSLSMIFFGRGGTSRLGWGIFGVGELVVVLVLLQAINRLRCAVLSRTSSGSETEPSQPLQAAGRRSLARQPFSVTEGTTELIDSANAPVAAPSSRDTDSMRSD
jgi:zinc-ribbon domain